MKGQFIPNFPYTLFHSSFTGVNNENVKSFFKRGISKQMFQLEVKSFKKLADKGIALKCVSSYLLEIEAMYAYVNKKWIDAKNLLAHKNI